MCMYSINKNIGRYVCLNSAYGKEIMLVEARESAEWEKSGLVLVLKKFLANFFRNFKSVFLIFISLHTLDTKIGPSVWR